jgi:hypothetical protein
MSIKAFLFFLSVFKDLLPQVVLVLQRSDDSALTSEIGVANICPSE